MAQTQQRQSASRDWRTKRGICSRSAPRANRGRRGARDFLQAGGSATVSRTRPGRRARQLDQCAILLGSATPSLESYQNAKTGKYRLVQLNSRVDDRQLPLIRVIDM